MASIGPKCILHAGMPKTGTTSIQQYLYDSADSSDQFVYVSQYEKHSGFDLTHLLNSQPTDYLEYTRGNLKKNDLEKFINASHQYVKKLAEKALDENKQLIFSWEGAFIYFNRSELTVFRDMMESYGFTVEVIIYVRPWKDQYESGFQQRIKGNGLDQFMPISPNQKKGISHKIKCFEEVFGTHAVRVFKYDTTLFENGDVVGHFCQQTGLSCKTTQIYRQNDSLRLPAIQFLYAYNRYGPMLGYGPAIKNNYLLIGALSALQGPSLTFHSSLLDSMTELIAQERPWLEQKMGGVSMEEDIFKHDNEEHTIKSESDMFNFSPVSLNWLAAQINARPVIPLSGELAAQKVAAQVHVLYKKAHGKKPLYYRLMRKVKTVIKRAIQYQP